MNENTTNSRYQRNVRRVVRVLRSAGVKCWLDVVLRYDKRTDYRDIKGIGPVLGRQLRSMLDDVRTHGGDKWGQETGMPWVEGQEEGQP